MLLLSALMPILLVFMMYHKSKEPPNMGWFLQCFQLYHAFFEHQIEKAFCPQKMVNSAMIAIFNRSLTTASPGVMTLCCRELLYKTIFTQFPLACRQNTNYITTTRIRINTATFIKLTITNRTALCGSFLFQKLCGNTTVDANWDKQDANERMNIWQCFDINPNGESPNNLRSINTKIHDHRLTT